VWLERDVYMTGENPTTLTIFGVYCQLGDGLIWSQEVAGASPVIPTILVNVRVGWKRPTA